MSSKKPKTVHWVEGPIDMRELRTACGRDVSPTITMARDRKLVTCASCLRLPEDWKGMQGYNFEARGVTQPEGLGGALMMGKASVLEEYEAIALDLERVAQREEVAGRRAQEQGIGRLGLIGTCSPDLLRFRAGEIRKNLASFAESDGVEGLGEAWSMKP